MKEPVNYRLIIESKGLPNMFQTQWMSLHPRRASAAVAMAITFAALPLEGLAQAPAAAPDACSRIAIAETRLACYDSYFGLRASSPMTGQAPGPAQRAAADFGLSAPVAAVAEATELSSQIQGAVDGWTATTRWVLGNGQVWAIADGSSAAYRLRDPEVRITRGVFGGFFIEIQGASQTPRVRRIK